MSESWHFDHKVPSHCRMPTQSRVYIHFHSKYPEAMLALKYRVLVCYILDSCGNAEGMWSIVLIM